MALTTYTELVASVGDWLNRPGDAIVPELITLNEASLRRRPEMQYEVYDDLDLDSAEITLPDDCREVRHVYHNSSTVRGGIEVVSPETLSEKLFVLGAEGIPRFGSVIENGTILLLAPTPDQTYPAKVVYLIKLDSLAEDNPTNWLLDEHPDIYLYGSLLKAEAYFKHDARIAVWREEFERAVAELDAFLRRRRYSANTLVVRPRRAIG
jgi:hypothetical protein